MARNTGNVIVQNVYGTALITRGRRVVARIAMGPGTFVTGTAIAYPLPTPREQPREGTVYRVRAVLHYSGRIVRLDTYVRFGRQGALRQQSFGGPAAPNPPGTGGVPTLLAVIATLVLAVLGAALLGRRRRRGARSPLPTLTQALAAARADGEPLSVILIGAEAGGAASRRIASVLRTRLRRSDRLCRVDGRGFLVVAPDTDPETANALAADLRRRLNGPQHGVDDVEIEVHHANVDVTAAELLNRVTRTNTRALALASAPASAPGS